MTPKDLAHEMGVSEKSLRRYMRSLAGGKIAGSGNRIDIDPDTADFIRANYGAGNRKVVKFTLDMIERDTD